MHLMMQRQLYLQKHKYGYKFLHLKKHDTHLVFSKYFLEFSITVVLSLFVMLCKEFDNRWKYWIEFPRRRPKMNISVQVTFSSQEKLLRK
jgi:hypothetical protein